MCFFFLCYDLVLLCTWCRAEPHLCLQKRNEALLKEKEDINKEREGLIKEKEGLIRENEVLCREKEGLLKQIEELKSSTGLLLLHCAFLFIPYFLGLILT